LLINNEKLNAEIKAFERESNVYSGQILILARCNDV